ncbi:Hsp20/alpha crystallin family protein [Legionella sainthelensi]|uniref:Hsp20/alpha crystallin family protein n=1 Tax=Legionella sainthelensi TaxID=28087 RepID=UPI000E20043C|nr:Hsp20/alpha crystallin family protein [Legionella sainthelensi]
MYREMGSLLDNFFNLQQRDDASFIETSTWSPLVDIKEEKDCFLVVADIPGVKKEDVSISLEQHILTLKGERHFEKTEHQNGYTRRERAQGQFYRRFSLPQTADDAKISAHSLQAKEGRRPRPVVPGSLRAGCFAAGKI